MCDAAVSRGGAGVRVGARATWAGGFLRHNVLHSSVFLLFFRFFFHHFAVSGGRECRFFRWFCELHN